MDQYGYALFLQTIIRNQTLHPSDEKRRSEEVFRAEALAREARRRRRYGLARAAWNSLKQFRQQSTVEWAERMESPEVREALR